MISIILDRMGLAVFFMGIDNVCCK